ncbi:MAG: carbohydrate kinase [Clostridiales bacterium]|nr:carbohydrate kinase [Clostridiales bacterium]
MKIAGLDIGTTGCKITVFSETGERLTRAYRDYPVLRSVGKDEMDVSVIMTSVIEVIREVSSQYDDIGAIGVTSFGETFVMTDDRGEPLHSSMLYTDPRGEEECAYLNGREGEMKIARITGLRPHSMYSLSKMMWIKAHQPDVYDRAKHIFLIGDYVVWHLTGNAYIDYSLASRTMAFDTEKLCWSRELLDIAGIDESLLSRPVPTGTCCGKITPEMSEKTKLGRDTLVVIIGHDQVAATVGAGVFTSDTAVDGAGTVQCLTPVFDRRPAAEMMYDGYYAIAPYLSDGKYVAYAFSYTGGSLIQWCLDTLCKAEKEIAKEQGVSVNLLLEQEYANKHGDEPSGLLVLPHFSGAATPYMDNGARGVIVGMSVRTTVDEIYRACMEGVAYEMYLNCRYLERKGVSFERIVATGGGARSRVWMQMKADMLNRPITALETVDAGTVGSAMLTGVACGVFKDLQDAAGYMVHETGKFEPRKEMHEKYMKAFSRYEGLYEAVRPHIE